MITHYKIRPWYMPLMPALEDGMQDDIQTHGGLNIYEKEGSLIVEAPVPGIPADRLEVTYTEGKLHIFGKHEETEEEKKKRKVVYKMERSSTYEYVTTLPTPIDSKSIEAVVKDGVARISAKIADDAKPKRISVKAV